MRKLVSVKNTGLSGNIIKFLITYDICERNGLHLVFPCDTNTSKILSRFTHTDNRRISFVEYSPDHKVLFNEKSKREAGDLYSKIYGEYIRKTYLSGEIGEFDYFSGNENELKTPLANKNTVKNRLCNEKFVDKSSSNNTILLDYNDGLYGYRKSLSSLNKKIRFAEIDGDSYVYSRPESGVFSFNLKTTTNDRFDSELLYWTEVLTQFKSDYRGEMFFVSGNKRMKREICNRFNVPFLDFEVENKFSNREGGELQRGSTTSAVIDLQNCVNTNFVPIERLVREYGIAPAKPGELFKKGKAEKFDLLVEFFKENHVLASVCSRTTISVGKVT